MTPYSAPIAIALIILGGIGIGIASININLSMISFTLGQIRNELTAIKNKKPEPTWRDM